MATWKEKYNKKYDHPKSKSHSLSDISKDTGVSKRGLQKIYNKGIGAWKTNIGSVRLKKDFSKNPNTSKYPRKARVGKEQWAMARVYSAVMGGKASKVDAKELKMQMGGKTEKINWSEYYKEGGLTETSMSKEMQERLFDENGERKIDRESIKVLTDYVSSLPQTKSMYFNESTQKYSPSRQKIHREILQQFKDELVCIETDEPIAILMGGSPASGKSTFLRKYAPYLLSEELLRIDADEVRSQLPEYEGWNASQTHLETKDIVNTLLSDRTIGMPCKFDLIYDGTMNNTKSYIPLIKLLRKLGYKIYVVYIDNVPKEVIEKRALERYGKSGRFVPLEVIDDFFSKGKTALNEIKKLVDGYMVVDGGSNDYQIIEEGGFKLPRNRAYSQIGYPTKELERADFYKGYYERLSPSNFDVKQKGGKIQIDVPMASSHDGIDEVDAIASGVFAKGGDIGDKIKLLKSEGYPQKQAVAIALDMKDRGKFEKGGLTKDEELQAKIQADDFMRTFRKTKNIVRSNKGDKVYERFEEIVRDKIGSGKNYEKGGETDFNPDGKIKDKIVHASGEAGGMLVGKRHSNGGIKAINKSTGQPLEMEGGEVVITRDAVSDNKKRSFNGKMMTNRQILSAINESGGGVSFADGGQVPSDVQFDCNAEYEYGGKTMCGKDLAYALGGEITKAHRESLSERLWDERGYERKYLSSLNSKELKSLYDTEFYYEIDYDDLEYASGGVTTAIVTDPNEAMADLQSTYGFGDVYAKGGEVKIPNVSFEDKDGKEFVFQGGKFAIFDLPNYRGAWKSGRGYTTRKNAKHNIVFIKLDNVKTDIDRAFLDEERITDNGFWFNTLREYPSVYQKYEGKLYTHQQGNINKFREKYFGRFYAKGGEVNEAYVDFMNKDKGFKVERKYFKTYRDAEKWARNEFEKFNPDMIGYTEYERPLTNYDKGGTIECGSCDWSWDRKDGGDDMYVCHKCGTDNTEKYNDAELFDDAREELGKEYLDNIDKFDEGGQVDVVETKETSFEEKFLENKISELRKAFNIKKRFLSEIDKGIALRNIRKYEIALDEIRLESRSFEEMINDFAIGQSIEFGDIDANRTLRKQKSINGEPSQLTKREYDSVRSESFIDWFGDWELAVETGNYEGVSKIINSQTKEPLVVYHGTDTKFTQWDTYEKNNLHYFAKKKSFADWFAKSWTVRGDDAGVQSAEIKKDNPLKGTFVYSCFLDIKNPIDFTPFGVDKVPFKDYLKYLEVKYDLDLSKIEGYNDVKDRTQSVYSWVVIRHWQQFNLFIKNNTPYDGFSFYEFIPESNKRGFEDASLSFTAFNSNQIKFTNNKTFSKFAEDSRLEVGGIIF